MKTKVAVVIQPPLPSPEELGEHLQWYVNQTDSPALYWYIVMNPIHSEKLDIRRCKSDVMMVPLIPYRILPEMKEMKPLEALFTMIFTGIKKIEDTVECSVIDWMNIYACIDEEGDRIWLGFSFLVKTTS